MAGNLAEDDDKEESDDELSTRTLSSSTGEQAGRGWGGQASSKEPWWRNINFISCQNVNVSNGSHFVLIQLSRLLRLVQVLLRRSARPRMGRDVARTPCHPAKEAGHTRPFLYIRIEHLHWFNFRECTRESFHYGRGFIVPNSRWMSWNSNLSPLN